MRNVGWKGFRLRQKAEYSGTGLSCAVGHNRRVIIFGSNLIGSVNSTLTEKQICVAAFKSTGGTSQAIWA